MNQHTSPPNRFVPELEALRGVAALMVALHHSLAVTTTTPTLERGIIQVLSVGRPAVTMFFVLSGFVLGASLRRQQGHLSEFAFPFCVRRLFRIYPAFLVTTLLIAPLFFNEATREWFTLAPHEPHPLRTLARNLLFIEASINMVTWTLKIELVASVLLPFFHGFTTFFQVSGKKLLLGGLLVLSIFPLGFGRWPCFLLMFYAGYLLPLGQRWISLYWSKRNLGKSALLALAFLTWMGAHILTSSDTLVEARSLGNRLSLLMETGACLMIIASLAYSGNTHLHCLLNHPLPRFLGTVSFSFYLIHHPVLLTLDHLALNPLIGYELAGSTLMRGLVAWAVSSTLASIIAWFLFRHVEKLGVDLGKRLTTSTH